MNSLTHLVGTLTLCFFSLLLIDFAAAATGNTAECRAFLVSEAERIENEFKKTVEESNRKLDSIFVAEHFEGNEDKALMMKGAYISFFNKKFKESILKIQTVPVAYRRAAKGNDYPKVCDKPAKFRETNDKAILVHAKLWDKALEDAEVFKAQ